MSGNPPQAHAVASFVTRSLPLGTVLAAMFVMLWWTWHRCPDPIIDFGRELYLAWRISEGDVLYRDLNHFNGPLAQHFNGWIFKLFGASLHALKLTNATIAMLVTILVYHLMRLMTDRTTATIAGVTFAIVFACGHLGYAANFNFLTPYSHELTHGVALSLLMILCLWQGMTWQRWFWLAGAGACLGLISLTKAEVFLAASVSVVVTAVTWLVLLHRGNLKDRSFAIAIFLIAAVIPPLLAIVLLARHMPLSQALSGVAGAWQWAGDPRLLRIGYFRAILGIDQPVTNAVEMLRWAGAYGLIVIPAAGIGWLSIKRSNRLALVAAAATSLVIVVALGSNVESIRWSQLGRPMPMFMGAIAAGLICRAWRQPEAVDRLLGPILLTCFAGALLAKMILNTIFFHYGFALSMPSAMVLIAVLFGWLPKRFAVSAGGRWLIISPLLAAWGVFMVVTASTSAHWLSQRIHPVGPGADRFLADERGQIVNQTIAQIRALTDKGHTLTAIPEGAMLNYLSRRSNPTRYQNFLPAEMMLFGEQNMLRELKERHPDWIALVHADTTVYDAPTFGEHYGQRIADWIEKNYHPARRIGAEPFTSDQFGILLLRRN